MNQKRDLMKELTGRTGTNSLPLSLDTDKIVQMVSDKLDSAEKGRKMTMIKTRKTSAVLIVAAVLLVMSVTAFAFCGIITSVNGSSSSKPDYLALPDAQKCLNDAGYVPILLESFENGYVFQDGNLVHEELVGEGNAVAERYEGFDFTYVKDGDTVELSQEKYSSEAGINPSAIVIRLDDVDLYYSSSIHKHVPFDYEPTEEELEAEAAGALSFGYDGPDTPAEENSVQALSWQINDIHYVLYQMNGALTAEELTAMAREIIAAK